MGVKPRLSWLAIGGMIKIACKIGGSLLGDLCGEDIGLGGGYSGYLGIDGETYPADVSWNQLSGFTSTKRIIRAASLKAKFLGSQCADLRYDVVWSYGGQINGAQGALMAGIDLNIKKDETGLFNCWTKVVSWQLGTPRNEGTVYWPIAAVDVFVQMKGSGGKFGCTMTIRGDGSAFQTESNHCYGVNVSGLESLQIQDPPTASPTFEPTPSPTLRPTFSPTSSPGSSDAGGYETAVTKSSSGCLGGLNRVELASGEYKYVKDLSVGDSIRTSAFDFEPVLALPPVTKTQKQRVFRLVQLTTSDMSVVSITPDHLILTKNKGTIPASDVVVGDFLFNTKGEISVVASKDETESREVYLPLTPSCKMILDNTIVSCASLGSLPASTISSILRPARFFHDVLTPSVYKFFHDQVFSQLYILQAAFMFDAPMTLGMFFPIFTSFEAKTKE